MANQSRSGVADIIWELLVSVKFTVFLLAVWLVGSVAGTLIPQNSPPAQYVELYGPTWSNLFMRFGLFDVYHSTWYALIMLLLMLAVTACSLNTYGSKKALAFMQPQKKQISGSGKKYITLTLKTHNPGEMFDKVKANLGKTFKQVDEYEKNGHRRLFAHRQPWAHFMVYVVHLSLVIIILGGMISALFGFEGRLLVEEGSQQSEVSRKDGNITLRGELPFALKLDSFEYQRFPDGRPKDWVSTLSVIEDGQVVLTKKIEVNDPLFYDNYNFYQSSWVEMAAVQVTDPASGVTATAVLEQGDETFLKPLNLAVAVESYFPSKSGMAASVLFAGSDGSVKRTLVSSDPEENANRQEGLPFRFALDPKGSRFISVLQVVSDPGVGFVWLGCFLMVVGLYLTFYSSHRRVTVTALDDRIAVVGLAQRNPTGFRRELEKALKEAGLDPTKTCSEESA
jgi:cytochrome c biogenesis protein